MCPTPGGRQQLSVRRSADRQGWPQTSKEGSQMSDITFIEKPLPVLILAQRATTVADSTEIAAWMGPAFEQLAAGLGAAGVAIEGPSVSWYRANDSGLEIAAGFPIRAGAELPADIELQELPAVARAVTCVHHGSMATIGESWQTLFQHLADTGATPVDRCREVYLHAPMGDQSDWVTELQQPIS